MLQKVELLHNLCKTGNCKSIFNLHVKSECHVICRVLFTNCYQNLSLSKITYCVHDPCRNYRIYIIFDIQEKII